MTDFSVSADPDRALAARKNLTRRRRSELILKAAGLTAISLAFGMLLILLGSLISTGWPAFTQTHVTLDVMVDAKRVKADKIDKGNYRAIIQEAMIPVFPDLPEKQAKKHSKILSDATQYLLRDRVVADPSLIGQMVTLTVPVADPFDQLYKGLIDRDTPEANRRLKDDEIAGFDRLIAAGMVSKPINWGLITSADSRFPELAGLRGALVGSFYALLTCFVISFPIGIGAAIYLEEFARKNKVSDFIEVNINNLAAVPSVVFGLLALAVFINWFGLPRSAPFVGGLTLALMTLPTIIIATRSSLKAVPPSIREAALGVGASRQQVVFDHVLPLAIPGILTGTIIGLARALGEAAPLLLIGMNAFITSAPSSPFEASTALPTQILLWAESTERGFVSRTSAAVLVLLAFLVLMNAVAIFLRQKFERRW